MLPCQRTSQSILTRHGVSRLIKFPIARQRRPYSELAPAVARRPGRKAGLILSATVIGGLIYISGSPRPVQAEAVSSQAELQFEGSRRKTSSREENRDLISSQHLQVKRSWENPGVYAWGSNTGRVVALDSDEPNIKSPRRIPYFDGKLIRDIKLDRNLGAAITENGDLLQWGTAFSPDSREPTRTLAGKDLVKISLSRDRIIALSSNGTVYSISAAKSDQSSESRPAESSWFGFWKSRSPISYRIMKIEGLGWGEKASDISSGLEHCLILTSSGRLFSAASGTEDFPSKGQLGIPGLTWATRPTVRSYDQPHEINTLKGFKITKIAAGDYHSLALDKEGRIFSFGDNSSGQLGFDYSSESPSIDAPSLLPIEKLYRGTNLIPRITHIAAGGLNSFLTVEGTRIAGQSEKTPRGLGRITADTWACGQGIFGSLGNGRWTHIQGTPSKIKALSGLFEYDEEKNTIIPIRLAHLSVGSTHAAAIMDNVTNVGAGEGRGTENDTNWGADVLIWGGNEFYQLGTGKRNNTSSPTYIPVLDGESDKLMGRGGEMHRFQITPRKRVTIGGRTVSVEQRIECGRGATAVYSGT